MASGSAPRAASGSAIAFGTNLAFVARIDRSGRLALRDPVRHAADHAARRRHLRRRDRPTERRRHRRSCSVPSSSCSRSATSRSPRAARGRAAASRTAGLGGGGGLGLQLVRRPMKSILFILSSPRPPPRIRCATSRRPRRPPARRSSSSPRRTPRRRSSSRTSAPPGRAAFTAIELVRRDDAHWVAVVPAVAVMPPGLEYYMTPATRPCSHRPSGRTPSRFISPTRTRRKSRDTSRSHARRSQIQVQTDWVDFGTRTVERDEARRHLLSRRRRLRVSPVGVSARGDPRRLHAPDRQHRVDGVHAVAVHRGRRLQGRRLVRARARAARRHPARRADDGDGREERLRRRRPRRAAVRRPRGQSRRDRRRSDRSTPARAGSSGSAGGRCRSSR